jgi:predicted ferric reductase
MSASQSANPELGDELRPAVALPGLVLILGGAVAGAALALLVLPLWVPALGGSLQGDAPRGYWYLARSSALVAYVLVWLSMLLGTSITSKLARVWPGGPTAFDLHQYTSLLGLGFALFHALILLGDHYIHYSIVQVLLPFAGDSYRPLAVGVGQVAIYLMAAVGLSFYVRRRIGTRTWRLIHFLSFAVYLMTLAHAVTAGTDSGALWTTVFYLGSGASLLGLIGYRVLTRKAAPARPAARPRPAVQ